MATMRECETIEKIAKIKSRAKSSGDSVDSALSGGKEYYRKVLSSIRASGICTMVTSTVSLLAAVVYSSIAYINFEDYPINEATEFVTLILVLLAFWAVPFIAGYMISKLESTPRFILGLLITTAIFNLPGSLIALPLISLIVNIVAIVRWSTYKDWFYNIK